MNRKVLLLLIVLLLGGTTLVSASETTYDAFGVQVVRQTANLMAEDVQIGRLSSRESKEHYVLARISFSPVRLVPPLNMISLLYKKTAVVTRWTEAEIKVPASKEQGF